MIQTEELKRLRIVKDLYETDLMGKPNVVGVGIGMRQREGRLTDELAIVVSVTQKVPICEVAPDDVIPAELDGVPVDVQVVGNLRAL